MSACHLLQSKGLCSLYGILSQSGPSLKKYWVSGFFQKHFYESTQSCNWNRNWNKLNSLNAKSQESRLSSVTLDVMTRNFVFYFVFLFFSFFQICIIIVDWMWETINNFLLHCAPAKGTFGLWFSHYLVLWGHAFLVKDILTFQRDGCRGHQSPIMCMVVKGKPSTHLGTWAC